MDEYIYDTYYSAMSNVCSVYGMIVAGIISIPAWIILYMYIDGPSRIINIFFSGFVFVSVTFFVMIIMAVKADNKHGLAVLRDEMSAEINTAYQRGLREGRYQILQERQSAENQAIITAAEKDAKHKAENELRVRDSHIINAVVNEVGYCIDELIAARMPRNRTTASERIIEHTEY